MINPTINFNLSDPSQSNQYNTYLKEKKNFKQLSIKIEIHANFKSRKKNCLQNSCEFKSNQQPVSCPKEKYKNDSLQICNPSPPWAL